MMAMREVGRCSRPAARDRTAPGKPRSQRLRRLRHRVALPLDQPAAPDHAAAPAATTAATRPAPPPPSPRLPASRSSAAAHAPSNSTGEPRSGSACSPCRANLNANPHHPTDGNHRTRHHPLPRKRNRLRRRGLFTHALHHRRRQSPTTAPVPLPPRESDRGCLVFFMDSIVTPPSPPIPSPPAHLRDAETASSAAPALSPAAPSPFPPASPWCVPPRPHPSRENKTVPPARDSAPAAPAQPS